MPRGHRIEVSFGEPITATGDADEVMEYVRTFFKNGSSLSPYRSPYRHRATAGGDHSAGIARRTGHRATASRDR